MSSFGERPDDADALRMARPSMYTSLGYERLLTAHIVLQVRSLGQWRVHICSALVVVHVLPMEHRRLLPVRARTLLLVLPYCRRRPFILAFRRARQVRCTSGDDAARKHALRLVTLPARPRTLIRAITLYNVQITLRLPLPLQLLLHSMFRSVHIDRHKPSSSGRIRITDDSWRVRVDGRVGAEAEDGVREVLLAESVLGHSLLFDVTRERILVRETVAWREGVFGTLRWQCHVCVGDVDVHLRVRRARDEGGLVEGILYTA